MMSGAKVNLRIVDDEPWTALRLAHKVLANIAETAAITTDLAATPQEQMLLFPPSNRAGV